MVRQLPGAFRAAPGSTINVQDIGQLVTAFQSLWTKGATLIDLVGIVPGQSDKWSLINVTIQANLWFQMSIPSFGKLGKIIGGISPSTSSSQSSTAPFPWVSPMIQLPADRALTGDMFDPAIDPLPPVASASPPPSLLPISTTISPPVPIPLAAGEPLALGIWVTPSLLGCGGPLGGAQAGHEVQDATYVVNYDDGR